MKVTYMFRRASSPRNEQQAREIARQLRKRFLSPEACAFIERELSAIEPASRQAISNALLALARSGDMERSEYSKAPQTPAGALLEQALQTAQPAANPHAEFSDEEKCQAKALLEAIKLKSRH